MSISLRSGYFKIYRNGFHIKNKYVQNIMFISWNFWSHHNIIRNMSHKNMPALNDDHSNSIIGLMPSIGTKLEYSIKIIRSPKIFMKKFHTCLISCQEADKNEEEERVSENKVKPNEKINSSHDRSKIVTVETSIKYLQSSAYKTTYGQNPVWLMYRRNFKGQRPPKLTRPTCIKDGFLITGNPCPICRDEYLIVEFNNVKLIEQFISQYTGEILPTSITNLCQEQQLKVEVAIEKAKTKGLLTFCIPFREYNYNEFCKTK